MLDTERLDAVELKITLTGPEVSQALTAFHLTARHGRRARIYFCELPSHAGRLPLLDAGLILRLRKHHGARDDATITLRPCRRQRLGPRWTSLHAAGAHEFRIDGDWSSSQYVLSATLVQALPRPSADHVVTRRAALSDTFSTLQHELVDDCADLHPNFADLQLFGPIETRRWALDIDDLPVSVEHWILPRTTIELLELSVRTAPADASFIRPALIALIRSHGLDPDAVTTAKARLALDHLANQHRPPSPTRREFPDTAGRHIDVPW